MKVNLSSIKTLASRITSNGASLLKRERGLDISRASELGITAPAGTTSFDVARVGRNFKHNEHYTDIFTFRGSDPDVVTQYIRKVDSENVVETTKKIKKLDTIDIDLVDDGSEVMDIFGTNIRTKVRENGKIKHYSDEVFAVTDEATPVLTHSKRVVSQNEESILLEQKQKGQPVKSIFNRYETDRFSTGDFRLLESKVSSDELKPIAQNSYFLPYVSPQSRFTRRITQAVIDDAQFIANPEVHIYKQASTRQGFYSHDGKVNLNLTSKRGQRQPRETITEVAGHEVEHAIWDEKCITHHMSKTGMFPELAEKFTPEEIIKIKKYENAINNYVPAHINKQAYWNNFAEVTAREGGKRATAKYYNLESAIKENFPFQHVEQFHPIEPDIDDMSWFGTIMGSV